MQVKELVYFINSLLSGVGMTLSVVEDQYTIYAGCLGMKDLERALPFENDHAFHASAPSTTTLAPDSLCLHISKISLANVLET